MKMVRNVHDLGYKSVLTRKDQFLHMLKKYIGASWTNNIKEDDLELIDKEFIPKDLQEKEADIIYKLKFKDTEVYFYVLLELQSKVDYTMCFRLLTYMTELMKRIFSDTDENHRKQKEFRLPAIIPIILYNGTRTWSAVNEFRKYLNNYEVFGDNIINFKYLLIDLNSTDKNYLLKTNTLIDNVFALDKTQSTEQLKENLKVVVKRLRTLSSDEQVALINWIKVILMKKVHDKNEINTVIELIKEGKVENMTYAIERVLDKEIKSARKMGKEEGKLEIAERLLGMGFTIEQIILATGLSQDQILNLKNQELEN